MNLENTHEKESSMIAGKNDFHYSNRGVQRNQNIDFFKGIACILIVFIHVPFPSFFGNYIIKPIARFTVPFFFMVSGYFLYHSNYTVVSKNMPKKIKRILLFAIISFVVYFIWALILNVIVWGISITEFIRVNFSLRKVVFFLCFNLRDISGLGGMAWYL